MSGYDLQSEYPVFIAQPYLQVEIADYITAWDDGILGERAGEPMAWLGVWPGDPRNRWIWPHGDTFDVHLGFIVHYMDWAIGDHLTMLFGAFQAAYIGQIIGGANTGVFVPYL